jgi:hypothetical protein
MHCDFEAWYASLPIWLQRCVSRLQTQESFIQSNAVPVMMRGAVNAARPAP